MVHYNVIEDRKKVVASLTNCQDDAYYILRKHLPNGVILDKNYVKMPSTFKATAKCHPNDTFDADIGMEIARKRVVCKYNEALSRVLTNYVDSMDDYLNLVDNKILMSSKRIVANS